MLINLFSTPWISWKSAFRSEIMGCHLLAEGAEEVVEREARGAVVTLELGVVDVVVLIRLEICLRGVGGVKEVGEGAG